MSQLQLNRNAKIPIFISMINFYVQSPIGTRTNHSMLHWAIAATTAADIQQDNFCHLFIAVSRGSESFEYECKASHIKSKWDLRDVNIS